MLPRLFSWFMVFCTSFSSSSSVFAETREEALRELKPRIAALEKKLNRQKVCLEGHCEMEESLGETKDIFEGLSIGGGATFILWYGISKEKFQPLKIIESYREAIFLQGTSNANGDGPAENGESIIGASYSIDLEFEKAFGGKAKAFIHLEAGDGAGVEDDLKVFSNVNRDADNSDNTISLTEAWYEHYFMVWNFKREIPRPENHRRLSRSDFLEIAPLTLTFGKIDPTVYIDTNRYGNDESLQFLGHIFRNSPVVEFPDNNAAGLRIALRLADFFNVEFVALDADADWEGVFDNMFLAGQLNLTPHFSSESGNYRVYGWINNKNHIKWLNPSQTKEGNYGFGLSLDQEISDALGLFARYGWQNPAVYPDGGDYSLEQSWSAGLQVAGSLWLRDKDLFGIAFGRISPSDDYKKAGSSLRADSEEHLELYYCLKINDCLTISPDLQVIWDPFGGDAPNGDKVIVACGLRTQVDF